MFNQVIDANVNRISEGLRVIEEYARFVVRNKRWTDRLAEMRHRINGAEPDWQSQLAGRDTIGDMRAKETPSRRQDLQSLLRANFKRVTEALRVLEEYTGNSIYNGMRYDSYELEKEILLSIGKPALRRGIYLISESIEVLLAGLEAGVALIQLRDKTASKAELLAKARDIAPVAKRAETPFIINDYLDVMLRSGADGLHTGQDDLPIKELRSIVGEDKVLGRTTHELAQGLQAEADGADYVSVGPIWETPSKPGRLGIGFDYLRDANTRLSIPYVAIGGIDRNKAREIAVYSPPMVGVVRAHSDIAELKNIFLFSDQENKEYRS
ncbi:thiamine phosphate synthase [bacterium]|nr:thiamine phosphate synthase [bacterium]